MKYVVRLDSNELYNLANELERYAEKYEAKVQIFLERLADFGISVAKQNEGDFAGYIVYSKKFEFDGEKQTVYMIARDSQLISKTWYISPKSAEMREESINPLLMAEFGSGHEAIKAEGEAAGLGGQGTLIPSYGHAFDADGWYWWSESSDTEKGDEIKAVSKKGRFKHHSKGVPPSRPLHNAVKDCIAQIKGLAQEVFG